MLAEEEEEREKMTEPEMAISARVLLWFCRHSPNILCPAVLEVLVVAEKLAEMDARGKGFRGNPDFAVDHLGPYSSP